jgi:transcription antitermination factor NusG
MSESKWYAVYTKPRWEKKVAEAFSKKQIENYCPLNKVLRQWSDRKKIIYEPLFTSYVFVCFKDKESLNVLQTTGVINFVYWLGKPAVIRHEEITTIKRFLNDYSEVRLEKTHVSLNDHVRIINGPLMTRKGSVLEVRNNTIKILLPSLGHALVAEVRKENVEKITAANEGIRISV